jgi:hypothetical protein
MPPRSAGDLQASAAHTASMQKAFAQLDILVPHQRQQANGKGNMIATFCKTNRVAASHFTAGGGEANQPQDRLGFEQQFREQKRAPSTYARLLESEYVLWQLLLMAIRSANSETAFMLIEIACRASKNLG